MPLVQKKFATLEEGFGYIESFTNLEKTNTTPLREYRLDRMRALFDLFDKPQEAVKTIHIAGTKGKGSTGIYLSSILKQAGLATGFYASPHVSSYTERITLAGAPFDESLYVEMINLIASRAPDLNPGRLPIRSEPTTFELLTLLGFLVFREAGCEWAVIETGIGGRLDATNVIMPEACLLTPVEREHTELLGSTLPQIAGEKAGIIKPFVPVFSGYQHPEVRAVFEQTARLRGAPIRFLADEVASITTSMLVSGSKVDIDWADGESDSFELAMPGEVQAENSALAVVAARSLFGGDSPARPFIGLDSVQAGLREARLPGRMEMVSFRGPDAPTKVVLDAAHTPVSVARLYSSFQRLFPGGGVLIFGSVLGKDPEGMAAILGPGFSEIIISTPGTFKRSDPEEVWESFLKHNSDTRLILDPREAFDKAVSLAVDNRPILVTGSFYMVAEIRALLSRAP